MRQTRNLLSSFGGTVGSNPTLSASFLPPVFLLPPPPGCRRRAQKSCRVIDLASVTPLTV